MFLKSDCLRNIVMFLGSVTSIPQLEYAIKGYSSQDSIAIKVNVCGHRNASLDTAF